MAEIKEYFNIIDFDTKIENITFELDNILKYIKYVLKEKYTDEEILKYFAKNVLYMKCDTIIKSRLCDIVRDKLEEKF